MPDPHLERRRFGRTAKLAAAVVALLLSLLISEGVVRLLGRAPQIKAIWLGSPDCAYRRSTNPLLSFELKPNFRSDNPDFVQSYERINSHGLRDRERTPAKPAGVRRVILLGDSVVEGFGLSEANALPTRLEALYPDGSTEVLNFGVSAYCTRAEVELLEQRGLAFDPDIVMLVFVENDFDNFNREAFPLGDTIDRPAVAKALFQRSHLFRLVSVRLNLFHFGAETQPIARNRDAIGDNNVVDGLARFAHLSDNYGFKPAIAIWPRFHDGAISDVHFTSGRPNELVIEALAAQYGIPTVRLSDHFARHAEAASEPVNPRRRYTIGDGLHPSAEGARVAAAALRGVIEDLAAGRLEAAPVEDQNGAARQAASALGAAAPNYARVYVRLGDELLKAGDAAGAAEHYRRAISEDTNSAAAHNGLGVACQRLGLTEARGHFETAIRLDPDRPQPRYSLARLMLKSGQTADAIEALTQTVRIDPDHTAALAALGVELGRAGRLTEAETLLRRLVELRPDDAEARNNLGIVLAKRGRLRAAAEQFEEATKLDPNHPQAAANLARAKRQLEGR